jgi:glucokinase
LLAGDIGGTKTLLGLFEARTPRPVPLAVQRYESVHTGSFEDVVADFLARHPHVRVGSAAFGVAGPVVGGRAQLTNHPWSLDAAGLGRTLGAPVQLVNDLEALAYSLDTLQATDTRTLVSGAPAATGPMAVLAVGTGMGAAQLVGTGERLACASESGHADFAPRAPRQDKLMRVLRRRYGRATVEHVLSGVGLVRLHQFTHDGWACPDVDGSDLPGKPAAVTRTALAGTCAACREALDLFVAILGSEAGNLALRTLPTGGLFLAGSVVAAVEPALGSPAFLEAFLDKPPMRSLLERVPLRLITTADAGLVGAAVVAQRRLR